jgi:hypothetical protein
MLLPPLLDPLGVSGATEVISIGGLAQPAALAGAFAGLTARRLGAIKLMMSIAVIGKE